MNIMFDIDGVLLDFMTAFSLWYKAKYDVDIPINSDSYNIPVDDLQGKLDQFSIDKGFMGMHAIRHAVYAFNQIGVDHKIHIVTAAPLKDRLPVMRNCGFNMQLVHDAISTEDKLSAVKSKFIKLCIEDAPKHINAFAEQSIRTFVPKYRYNEGIESPFVTYYDDIVEIVDRIREE